MKPRPWPRDRVAFGPAVLAAAAVLALVSAVPGPALGQSPGGWKRGWSGPARSGTAESALPTPPLAERSGFYSNLGLLDSISRDAVNAIADSLALPPGSAITLYASTPHEANWFVGNILGEILAERGYKVRILDWGPAPAGGASSTTPPATSPPPVYPNRPPPGEQQGGQGESTPPADTTAVIPDSTQAEADSVQSGQDGGLPAESAVTPAPEQTAAAALRELPAGEVLDLRVVEFGVSYADIGRKLLFGPLRFTRVAGVYLQVSSRREPEGELRQVLSVERHRVDRLSGAQRSLAEGASYPFNIPELKAPGLGRYIEPTVVVGIVGSLVYLFYANQSSK